MSEFDSSKLNEFSFDSSYLNDVVLDEKLIRKTLTKFESGQMQIEDVNMEDFNEIEAAIEYIVEKPSIVKKFISKKELFIFKLLLCKSKLSNGKPGFVYVTSLDSSQMSHDILECYLYHRLQSEIKNDSNIYVKRSYDNSVVIEYSFKPVDGTQVSYFDSDFKVPVTIVGSLKGAFKIVDQTKLFKSIDLSVNHVGLNTIEKMLFDCMNKSFRTVISEIVIGNKVGYYSLSSKYFDIEKNIVSLLNDYLSDNDVKVIDLTIKNISLLEKDLFHHLTESYFNSRITGIKQELRIAYENLSLDIYEQKAIAQNKNPKQKDNLTEAEKDNALRRYSQKEGLESEHVDSIPVEKEKLPVLSVGHDSIIK